MLICWEATSTAPVGGVPITRMSVPAKIFKPQSVTAAQDLAIHTHHLRGAISRGRKRMALMAVKIRNKAERTNITPEAGLSPRWRDIWRIPGSAIARSGDGATSPTDRYRPG